MVAVGCMAMPAGFIYRDVYIQGKPRHEKYDSFSIRHPKMDVGHRAKIFAPFDALKGFNEAVASKDVLYESRRIQPVEDRDRMNQVLSRLYELTCNSRVAKVNRVQVEVTYYVPCSDENSEAYGIKGQYRIITGICRNVDPDITKTILVDDTRIPMIDIWSLELKSSLTR